MGTELKHGSGVVDEDGGYWTVRGIASKTGGNLALLIPVAGFRGGMV